MENKEKTIESLKEKIDVSNLPNHVAIIMDGNGRWAKKRFLPRTAGHKEGMERVKEIVEVAAKIGIKYLSLYAFSTENWKRPEKEINGLMKLLVQYLRAELNTLHKNNIKVQALGDISKLPLLPRIEVEKAIEKTKNNDKMTLNIALNYGGRDEIIEATKNILKDVEMGKMDIEELNVNTFNKYLYTKNQPDPDLLIRPSGELRISNFLLYQIAYTEFCFYNIYWPDFREEHFYRAIIDYQKRDRRYGGI
ncbi:isoprenyl transferase [Anaerosalibacter bizertensis]|uniref:Isoprenyl transferase n=1 Tax=Anaerosalibacter bizertensis TaxID=932217 RepID=A0A844FG02_9FIRM|nr:isoprenyl transferase [Anaerosalibacter bizertensis]MBV1818050.1 isoprenyl transferase [Bacteroidales bacterium MSK.15.36]MBU5293263.1 isoprenyl transferase [Anaerosalibacter bizertensis]MCB5558787.1 isoprenyl transferase [Anaerosalibacter bizertensis]MCG4564619.1 isoprenyl transferase [Anaerosalibacter bizertensis]MCG4582275.1 isoprenyl transferase [Anaerosalibacter bizertensis]